MYTSGELSGRSVGILVNMLVCILVEYSVVGQWVY